MQAAQPRCKGQEKSPRAKHTHGLFAHLHYHSAALELACKQADLQLQSTSASHAHSAPLHRLTAAFSTELHDCAEPLLKAPKESSRLHQADAFQCSRGPAS